jgi:hypothetical protein
LEFVSIKTNFNNNSERGKQLLRSLQFLCMYCRTVKVKKGKAIPVTGCGGLYGCDMLRIPHCLDNRLIDAGKVVSSTHRPHFTSQKHYYSFLMLQVLISVRG